MKNEKGFTLIELLVTLVFLGCVVAGSIALFANGDFQPDASVLKAAKSMTSAPQVSKGYFAWVGCSNGDTFRYDVSTSTGEYIGYVCQGWSPIPGIQKGATPRF